MQLDIVVIQYISGWLIQEPFIGIEMFPKAQKILLLIHFLKFRIKKSLMKIATLEPKLGLAMSEQ